MLAGAIHREYFLLQCLKKEIATTKELDLRQLGKVIIFRDRQTNKTFLLYIDHYYFYYQLSLEMIMDGGIASPFLSMARYSSVHQ